ncbi:MAG TPA: carboxypeptidase-like regulatory domain-containing protein, partial [Kofleriaceae bacterium]|nr:carboxypeptidase-like regulatory domain-containing protein [Kofleriaceae bacterium]
MKTYFAALAVVGAAALLTPAHPLYAQPADAIGRPLPGGDLPVGTVTVRVAAGAPSKVVSGADVTLTVNGTGQVARTDASGRATFAGLPPGASVQATIMGADGKPASSQQFTIPDSGGTKLMLTTVPWGSSASNGGGAAAPSDNGAGGGPMMGGAGMPKPRELSGRPRPEQADPGGQITVRLAYDSLTDATKPSGIPVQLVGYGADDSIVLRTEVSDAEGRVVFKDLDKTGGTSYFA